MILSVTTPDLTQPLQWFEYGFVIGGLVFIVSILWKWLRRSLDEQKETYELRLVEIEKRQEECERDRAQLHTDLGELSRIIAETLKKVQD